MKFLCKFVKNFSHYHSKRVIFSFFFFIERFGVNMCDWNVLQAEIEKKINQIGEVIDMLNKIIDGDKTASGSPDKKMKESKSDDSSPERLKSKVIESLAKKRKDSERVSTRDEE